MLYKARISYPADDYDEDYPDVYDEMEEELDIITGYRYCNAASLEEAENYFSFFNPNAEIEEIGLLG